MSLVTVVIPSYNCEQYIAQTLESVLTQDVPGLEVIVVDDGSTDRTRDIVASYGERVRLIPQENARVCAARNRGIREAKGQYICVMDHDDYWFPGKLSQQIKAMEEKPDVGVVYSSFLLWSADEDGQYPSPESFDLTGYPEGIDPEYSGWIYHQFLIDCWMLTSTAMFRAEVFERCGLFDETLPFSEDWDLWLRMSREYPFLKLQKPTTLYRQHASQENRRVRDTDYRTLLLTSAVAKWGLCSRDNRCTPRWKFLRQLAKYHTSFGLLHLAAGHRTTSFRSFLKALIAFPFGIRPVAYIFAGLLGWRPV